MATDPEALQDGALSKSTMRRRAAMSHTPEEIEAAARVAREAWHAGGNWIAVAKAVLSAAEAAGWQPPPTGETK